MVTCSFQWPIYQSIAYCIYSILVCLKKCIIIDRHISLVFDLKIDRIIGNLTRLVINNNVINHQYYGTHERVYNGALLNWLSCDQAALLPIFLVSAAIDHRFITVFVKEFCYDANICFKTECIFHYIIMFYKNIKYAFLYSYSSAQHNLLGHSAHMHWREDTVRTYCAVDCSVKNLFDSSLKLISNGLE